MNGIPPLSSRDAHASPPQRVLERLHSSAAGLDADEAARRLAAHGYNRLPAPKRQGPLLRLLRQFHNVLLYMMLFASLVTALLGFWVDSAVILLAVVVNALIGFVQEGKVGIRNVDVGNLVRVGDSLGLFSVTQIAPISVVFSLQQEQLPQLQALLGGEAAVRAYSRDGGSALGEGRLLTIDNQIDSSTGTIRVRASFDNRQARLWPGQFVAVSLHTGVRRDQLVLSSKAVRRGLEGNFVYRVAADRVEAVPVRVLQDIDGLSVVEGLASGDQVVVDGHSRLMPGALVDIQEPRPSLAQAAERQP